MNVEGWDGFLELCLSIKEKDDIGSLLDLFLTEEEKENLALRFLIIRELLLQNRTQREIAKELHVSIAKITRGSNELKRIQPKLLAFLLNQMGSKIA
jgi:TrpR family transcriptional regulator, trp operon repressor